MARLDDNGDFVVGGAAGGGESSDPVSLQRIVGGKLVALKPDESLDSFQSNRPSPTFTGFLEHLRRDSALGVIPFEFAADSSKIGGAGVRLIVAKADRRFSFRQMILERRLIQPGVGLRDRRRHQPRNSAAHRRMVENQFRCHQSV